MSMCLQPVRLFNMCAFKKVIDYLEKERSL